MEPKIVPGDVFLITVLYFHKFNGQGSEKKQDFGKLCSKRLKYIHFFRLQHAQSSRSVNETAE